MASQPTELPRITIATVTRNRARHLQRTLDGVLADDYPNREVIVVDGASTDGTVELLRSYGDRIRWISEPDRGEYDAWNKAARMATGEIFKWLPDDDRLRPGAPRLAAAYLAEHPEVDIVFGQTQVWQEHPDGTLTPLPEEPMTDASRLTLKHFLRQTHGVTSVAMFARRRVLDRLGPFAIDYACGDTEFWVRAAANGVTMGVMPETVVDYTITGMNGQIVYNGRIARDLLRINWHYGSIGDVTYTLWHRRTSILGWNTVSHEVGRRAAAMGLHPRRTLRNLRKRVLGE